MNDIGKNIKALRTRKNMTQDELAEKLFVTRQTVSNYEVGKSRPDIDMLMKIAEVLGADINELLYGPEDTAERRKRILLAAAGFAVLAVLWFLLQKLIAYSTSTYQPQFPTLSIFARLVLQPAYFFLLGWVLTSSVSSLRTAPPLPGWAARSLRLTVWILTALLLLVLFPYYSVMLSSLGIPYIRVPSFWLKLTYLVTNGRHFIWMSLLLGVTLGLCGTGHKKPKK